jgi:adenylate kinase family enzyme
MTKSPILEEYVARIEEACGEEKDVIIHFKYEKKDEAITKILKKVKVERTVARIIFDLTYKGFPIRLYNTGKAIFKKVEEENQAQEILAELLL